MAEKTKKQAAKPEYIDDALEPGKAAMEAAGNLDADAEARRQLILDMQARARANVCEHEVHQLPLEKEIGGLFVKSERSKPRKGDDKEPGMIHTLDMGAAGRIRFWGFGILDFHIEENKIQPGDFIVVTRKPMNEKKFWTCDFGFAKQADVEQIGEAHEKGGD